VQCSFEQRFGSEAFIGVTNADGFTSTALNAERADLICGFGGLIRKVFGS
jgi:hypothetical protein